MDEYVQEMITETQVAIEQLVQENPIFAWKKKLIDKQYANQEHEDMMTFLEEIAYSHLYDGMIINSPQELNEELNGLLDATSDASHYL